MNKTIIIMVSNIPLLYCNDRLVIATTRFSQDLSLNEIICIRFKLPFVFSMETDNEISEFAYLKNRENILKC